MLKLIRVGILTLLAVIFAVAPLAAQSAVPGVTDTEIVIGLTAPMSGPAAIYGNLAVAKQAWARYVNDLGGVHGRKLKVVLKDDGFNPGRAVANLKEMKDSIFLTLGLVGSAVVNAAREGGDLGDEGTAIDSHAGDLPQLPGDHDDGRRWHVAAQLR